MPDRPSIHVRPGDLAAVSINGLHVAATAVLHVPSGRLVDDWTAEDCVILGRSAHELEGQDLSVTPWERRS